METKYLCEERQRELDGENIIPYIFKHDFMIQYRFAILKKNSSILRR